MAIQSKLEQYQYGVHVRKGRPLYTVSDKKIYFGEWLMRKTEQIIIIEMSKQIADREAPFYLEVNGHENIIRTFGSIGNPSNLVIYVQEYAPQGDLADCLMDNQFQFTQLILLQMFIQIADAMSYVARKKVVHGDLGCRNVLVFQLDSNRLKNNLVKITDFGLARWIERPPANEDTTIVPIRYCAPEILRHNRHGSYSEKSDVYSFGVLIWEALSNSEIPYAAIDKDEDVRQKKLNHERLLQPQGCDRQLWVRMNDCWHKDPQQRPTFDEIKDRLSEIKIYDVPHDLITSSSHRAQIHCDYELDINVKIKGTLNRGDPSIYEAQWITGDEQCPILLIEQKEEPSEHEKLFYTVFKDHPHIVRTFGFVGNDRDSIMILQERAPHGNLQVLLGSGQFQPTARVLVEIFTQIINAMIDITKQGLVHGDLRCENVLVFQMHPSDPKGNSVKLANFTLAHPNDRSYTDERRLFVPIRYCALEILRSAGRSNYSELSDVYSMGVLMWEAYSKGKRPYDSSETNGEVRQRKMKGEKLTRPLLCDEQIWSIMEDCWHNEPQLRFEFKDMKTRFSHINLQSVEPYQYELNKNIKQNRPLSGMNGRFYEAEWIPKKEPPILLYVIDGPTAEDEALLSIKLSSHPCIIRTYGLVKNDRQLVILLQERALHGNLQALLQSGNFQPSPMVLVAIFLQIVDAVIYITNQDIVHGDLRCVNVLVFQMDSSEPTGNRVKLTNFSMACPKGQSVRNHQLPDSHVRYCAPELLRSEDGSCYSELSDVYSMGVLMWEGCSKGEVPYGRRTSDRDVRQQRLNNTRFTQPKECHIQIWSVIEDCCCNEPDLRFTFEQLKKQLEKVNIKPIILVHCYHCSNSISENDMASHQQSCVPPMPPVDPVDVSDNKFSRTDRVNPGYIDSDEENDRKLRPPKRPRVESAKSNVLSNRSNDSNVPHRTNVVEVRQRSPSMDRHSIVSTEKVITYRSCKHCGESYPADSVRQHETSYCPKRFPPPPPPVVEIEPKRSSIECANCHKQIPSNEMTNHRRTCKPGPAATTVQPASQQTPLIYGNNQPPPVTKVPQLQVSDPPRAKSFCARICPCLGF